MWVGGWVGGWVSEWVGRRKSTDFPLPSPKGEVSGVVEKCTQRPVHTVATDPGCGAKHHVVFRKSKTLMKHQRHPG